MVLGAKLLMVDRLITLPCEALSRPVARGLNVSREGLSSRWNYNYFSRKAGLTRCNSMVQGVKMLPGGVRVLSRAQTVGVVD